MPCHLYVCKHQPSKQIVPLISTSLTYTSQQLIYHHHNAHLLLNYYFIFMCYQLSNPFSRRCHIIVANVRFQYVEIFNQLDLRRLSGCHPPSCPITLTAPTLLSSHIFFFSFTSRHAAYTVDILSISYTTFFSIFFLFLTHTVL